MSEALYPYYERELLFIRQLAQEFAKQYPAAAGRLLLEPTRSTDPHVERLIESFALLARRVHQKLDDEFPEWTDAILGILYPHYQAPIPSMAIIQFDLDPGRAQLPKGFLIDKGIRLHTQPVGDVPCKFRTCYPVTLWPVELASAKIQPPPFPPPLKPPPKSVAALRLQLNCQADMQFPALTLAKLRFFLYGDNHLIANLFEVIFNNVIQVVFRSLDDPKAPRLILSPQECRFQVGFGKEEGLLPFA